MNVNIRCLAEQLVPSMSNRNIEVENTIEKIRSNSWFHQKDERVKVKVLFEHKHQTLICDGVITLDEYDDILNQLRESIEVQNATSTD